MKAWGLSLLPEALSAAAPHRIENGFVSSAGVSADGWYAGIVVLDNQEPEFCKGLSDPGRWACAYNGEPFDQEVAKAARWRAAITGAPRRLVFACERSAGETRELASAERICGPAAARGNSAKPALVWTERQGQHWTLRYFDGDHVTSCFKNTGILRSPSVAVTTSGAVLACEREAPRGPEVLLLNPSGTILHTTPGSNPRLAGAGATVFMLIERATRDRISLTLLEFAGSRLVREVAIPSADDYTKNADLFHHPTDGAVLVAAECCPAFGISEQLGSYRAIRTWRLPAGKVQFAPWPAEGRNEIPAGTTSVPLLPRLFRIGGQLSVAYRCYRPSSVKGTYGWDVWSSSFKDGTWQAPQRLTSSYGPADTGFDVLESRGRQIGVFPCREHFPLGHISRRYWIEIVDLTKAPQSIAPSAGTAVVQPASGLRGIAPEPPPLQSPPAGLQLIWGDLHHHTAYSTCQAPTNGMPQDHLRFSRDVLGCDILTLTEHGHHMIEPESTYVQDRVEEAAGGKCIVLYADEPNPEPGRHTIFYTIDRNVFDRLRTIFLSHGRARPDVYRHIHRALAAGSVIAISHFHGHPLRGEAMRKSFDPELDIAMEAMQIRGNVMLQLHRESEGLLFPNDCLSLGLKVGLVAGTDHTFAADVRRNHFCLTGLWVRERTPAGVFEALRARRTVAMSDGKISVWATLDGKPMGTALEHSGRVTVHARLACARKILRVGLMRDGAIRQWLPVGAAHADLELVDAEPSPGYHWYVVTAETETAYGTPGYCHASPFFVDVRA